MLLCGFITLDCFSVCDGYVILMISLQWNDCYAARDLTLANLVDRVVANRLMLDSYLASWVKYDFTRTCTLLAKIFVPTLFYTSSIS